MRESALRFVHAPGVEAEADRALYGDLDDPILRPTIDKVRRDLLEGREDARAGRVCTLDEVLIAIDEAYERGVKRRRLQNGDPVD